MDGKDIVFVNGYRKGKSSDSDRGRSKSEQNERRDNYWNNVNKNFTSSVGEYFNDNKHHFLNASDGFGSSASNRHSEGYYTALEMIKSGEIIIEANNPITLVGHSQSDAFIVGMADALKDYAWSNNTEVNVNLVMFSVHQPEDINVKSDIAPNAIQFTYENDNGFFVAPMAIEGKEVKGVFNANSDKINFWDEGYKAHSATVDDKSAFEHIKQVDQEKHIFIKKEKDK